MPLEANMLLRLGMIEYYNNNKHKGWENILQAVLLDNQIEKQDSAYLTNLNKIILEKTNNQTEVNEFFKDYREQNRDLVPKIEIKTFENQVIKIDQNKGKVLFINFFSPLCGTCQQELPMVNNLYKKYSQRDDILFILINNDKDMEKEAIDLIAKIGFEDVTLGVVENGSSWDYITEEPTIWIVNKHGRIVKKHLGYNKGDEKIYQQEILSLF